MSLVIQDADHGHRIKPGICSLLLCESGPAAVQGRKQADNSRTQTAAIASSCAKELLCHGSCGKICRGTHGGPLPLSGQRIFYQRTVSRRIDIGKAGSHLIVHHDRAPDHLDSRLLQESRCRTHTDSKNNQVRGKPTAVRDHAFRMLLPGNPLKAHGSQDAHTAGLKLTLCKVRHLPVKGIWHDLGRGIDHRHIHFQSQKVFRHLKADKAGSAHNRPAAFPFLRIGTDCDSVIRRSHTEYSRKILSFHGRNEGNRTRGDDQPVIAFLKHRTVRTPEGYLLFPCVKTYSLASGPHNSTRKPGVLFRRIDNQLLSGAYVASDVIGQAAARIGYIRTLRKNFNLGPAVKAL